MPRMALRVLVLVVLLSLVIAPAASAAVCPGGPGPTCIELRVKNPPVATNTPFFTAGGVPQTWPGGPGCLPDVTPNWAGSLVTVDSTAPVAPPIQLCYNGGNLWVRSGRDVGAMAGLKWVNDLENVSFELVPTGKLFTSVSVELECQGPATRQHSVQVYYYLSPGVLCEQQLIEPPLYPAVPVIPGTTSAPPHGAPGINRYVLQTSNTTHPCSTAGGFRRIEIEPQVGSACDIVNVWDFRTTP